MDAALIWGEELSVPEKWEPISLSHAMKYALQEALRGAGSVSPNPLVGCVILDRQGRFLASGYHAKYGFAHAEINALESLSSTELEGAIMVVTLEPCAHEGKTPSCAKHIAKLPVAKIFFGVKDPNPLVAGKGAEILRLAGKEVFSWDDLKNSVVESEHLAVAEALNIVPEHFLWNMQTGLPFVSLKVAASLDGIMALQSGESKWITNDKSRRYAHYLRAYHDAVLVGSGTLLTDDPMLNVRLDDYQDIKKRVVVLDPSGKSSEFLANSALLKAHNPEKVIVMSEALRPKDLPEGLVWISSFGGDLRQSLKALWNLGIKSVLVEGGAKVHSSFINNNLAQRLYFFQSPVILGGKTGRVWTEQVSIDSMDERRKLSMVYRRSFGSDLLLTGRF